MSANISELRSSIELLSLEPELQLKYLRDIGLEGDIVDELALKFDDIIVLLPEFVKSGLIPKSLSSLIAEIEAIFLEMSSSSEECWTVNALQQGDSWSKIREISKICLEYF